MIIDAQNTFANAQLLTATAISTNVIDTNPSTFSQTLVQNLGGVGAPFLVISVPVALTSAGATTLVITLESDSTANLATAPVVHWSSGAIPKATLVAGYQFLLPMPIDNNVKRYLGLRFTVATGPFTGGSISGFLSHSSPTWKAYGTGSASNI